MTASADRRVRVGRSARPLTILEFARLMEAVGPFEARPHLAIAISGGADSLALTLLADRWARRRSGRIVALTVDHGLRSGSAGEARQVGRWLERRGIAHRVLRWKGDKPKTGLQAAARDARYRLLTEWCARRGILHLLLAHHQGDQIETFLLRIAGRSGVDGLAGMSSVVEQPDCRLVRPLLAVARPRLEATLKAERQDWIEDPSNRDTTFARVRIRTLLPALAAMGPKPSALAAVIRAAGRARTALDAAAWELLARSTDLAPEGYARVRLAPLRGAARSIAERAVQHILLCIGGPLYPPRRQRLTAVVDDVLGSRPVKARTLAGCRIIPEADTLVVCPENRVMPAPVRAVAGAMAKWADRFEIAFGSAGSKTPAWIEPLGSDGWSAILSVRPDLRRSALPFAVRLGLPALVTARGIRAVHHLGFHPESAGFEVAAMRFQPRRTLSGLGFLLAQGRPGTI